MKLSPVGLFVMLLASLVMCGAMATRQEGMSSGRKSIIGGCKGTQYGCCPDGKTAKKEWNDVCASSGSSGGGGSYAQLRGRVQSESERAGRRLRGGSPEGVAVPGDLVVFDPPQAQLNGAGYSPAYDPRGVSRGDIPAGDEDLYILKSEVVPPVCPACPQSTACPRQERCPPCPPCARCPEPAFTCEKVPNYRTNNSDYLPRPVLADFSQFGM